MNICIIGQYPPQLGGVATYTKNLHDTLLSQGHNVYVLTYKQNIKADENVFYADTLNIPVLRGLSFIISSYRKLGQIIDKYDIDVVHANYLLPPALIATLRRKKGVKIISTAHGSDINQLASNMLTRPFIKYTLKHSDEVYFVSDELKQKALNLGVDIKSQVIPNCVNIDKFKPSDEQLSNKYNMPVVVFIGNLVKQKGLNYLLEAKKLSKSQYTLLIYGDGPLKDELQSFIDENSLKDTYLMGKTHIPWQIIPRADIMVLPSVSEGASIVALESMASGKPLIATRVGNIEHVIENQVDGVLVDAKNSTQLKDAIDTLLDDKNLRIEIGRKARKKIIDKYSEMKIPYIGGQK